MLMQTKRAILCLALGVVLLPDQTSSQGPLTPSGAPAPTMKTLQQVEPRTDLATLAGDSANSVIIAAPGSYYLSANLLGVAGKNGILINADNVSIDLNGFAIICPIGGVNPASGVLDSGNHRNLSIANGTVRGWGVGNVTLSSNNVELRNLRLSNAFGDGNTTGTFNGDGFNGRGCVTAHIENCVATGNAGDGLATGTNSVVSNCVVSGNKLSGFSGGNASFTNCTANANIGFGYFLFGGCVVTNCNAVGNGIQGTGFLCSDSVLLTNCLANGNVGSGFDLYANCTAMNCVASKNGGDGFHFTSNNLLTNNSATGNTGDGFHGISSNNRIDSNHAIGNAGAGIHSASSTADFTIRNTAYGNTPNYNPASGPYIGPTTTIPSTATSAWANF